MTKTEPLLSICIPTYNREKYLKRLLDSIVCQKEFIDTDDVEIVVDDGPSSDNTESMVKDYIKKYGDKIKYFRNPVRIGMCPAFLEALDLGIGKYLRLFGSDDFMAYNSLGNVMNCIIGNPKLIYSKRKEIHFGAEIEQKNDTAEVLSFNGMNEFSEYLGNKNKGLFHDKDVLFTFISVFCIERDYYKESYAKLIKNKLFENILKDNYFNFSLIAFGNIKDKSIISIINNPVCVYCEDNNMGWMPNKKVYEDLKILINYIENNYNISYEGKKFFKKEKLVWYLSNVNNFYNITLYIIKKIGLYGILKKIYRYIKKYL